LPADWELTVQWDSGVNTRWRRQINMQPTERLTVLALPLTSLLTLCATHSPRGEYLGCIAKARGVLPNGEILLHGDGNDRVTTPTTRTSTSPSRYSRREFTRHGEVHQGSADSVTDLVGLPANSLKAHSRRLNERWGTSTR